MIKIFHPHHPETVDDSDNNVSYREDYFGICVHLVGISTKLLETTHNFVQKTGGSRDGDRVQRILQSNFFKIQWTLPIGRKLFLLESIKVVGLLIRIIPASGYYKLNQTKEHERCTDIVPNMDRYNVRGINMDRLNLLSY